MNSLVVIMEYVYTCYNVESIILMLVLVLKG